MYRIWVVLLAWLLAASSAFARQERGVCGTHRDGWKEELHLHRAAKRARELAKLKNLSSVPFAAASVARDIGNIALIEDSEGVVARRNEFNLDQRTLTFTPVNQQASTYRFQLGEAGYDTKAASDGTMIAGIGDDDTRAFPLSFPFPFFGVTYNQVWVNSDGNLTFNAGDNASSERSLGRMASGSPRIAALYRDLDPTKALQGVRVLSTSTSFVVSWAGVPEFQDYGIGLRQTFQIRLYPDGRIEFGYAGISTLDAVVGISPGELKGSAAIVAFFDNASAEYSSTVAERFGGTNEIDVTTAAQRFFETHEDAYDYLVIFNNLGISAGQTALAFTEPLRSSRSGIGSEPLDIGREYGSAYRLQALINMGSLGEYPSDPYSIVPARAMSRDTPMSVIAHEAGHLFLAYASVRDPDDGAARPMLGYQGAHWKFVFNSEASLLEGNRIEDRGGSISPRFLTTGTVEAFSPLDQYLMGFRGPEELPPTFLVMESGLPDAHPRRGVQFDGKRRDIAIQEIIQAEGRRTPDHTVAQRRFRFAFILVVAQGTTPPSVELDKIETFRREFEAYFQKAASDRAQADATLKKSLRLSLFPSAGVLEGKLASASVITEKPLASALRVNLRTPNGLLQAPASVTIPPGARSAAFEIRGLRAGVEELFAEPADEQFEIVNARVQVANASDIRLETLFGDRQTANPGVALPSPVVLRVTDINKLPYPGVTVEVTDSSGGSVAPPTAVSDWNGVVEFRWTPGSGLPSELRFRIAGASGAIVTTVSALGRPVIRQGGVVNAASFTPSLSPGALGTVYGFNLSGGTTGATGASWPDSFGGVRVMLNGRPSPLIYVSDYQINFLVAPQTGTGPADLVVSTPLGSSGTASLSLGTVSPGIFFDPVSGYGAILNAGTGATTAQRPVKAGDAIEIYCTGLGALRTSSSGLGETVSTPSVFIGEWPAKVLYSGLAPGFLGLYQVNAQVPSGLASGARALSLLVDSVRSNEVKVGIE